MALALTHSAWQTTAPQGVNHLRLYPDWRQVTKADLELYLERVRDGALRHALEYGVAFLHETQAPAEQEVVNTLFSSGAIQVLCRCTLDALLMCCCILLLHFIPASPLQGLLLQSWAAGKQYDFLDKTYLILLIYVGRQGV